MVGKYHISEEPIVFIFSVYLNHSSSFTAHGLLTIPTALSVLPHEVSLLSTAVALVEYKANDENMPGYKDLIASLTAKKIPV
jgi:hypothetical protein